MKKQKAEHYPLPVGCTPYRPSFSLGLWLTALQYLTIFLSMEIPACIALGIVTEPSVGILLGILLPIGTGMAFCLAWPLAALIGRCSAPRAGIWEGRLYLTNRKRSIPLSDIRAWELYLGHFSKHRLDPPRLTIHLPNNDDFEITRPSLRLLRDIRRAAPQAAFSANWKDTFLLFGIIGFAGGVIFAAVLLLKGL